jgi:hypothetical protein
LQEVSNKTPFCSLGLTEEDESAETYRACFLFASPRELLFHQTIMDLIVSTHIQEHTGYFGAFL